jgi:hypothetical protein
MNVENVGKPVAIILNETDKQKNKALYVESKKENVINPMTEIILKSNEKLQQIPDTSSERMILYITGSSGSGKSFYTRQFCETYRKLYPKREIYLFSSLTDDSSIDKIKGLKRLKITPELMNEDLSAADFKDSLVIFDDTDCITDKLKKAKINGILNSLLETGRHFNASVIYTSHLPCAGNDTKRILNEAHSITIFPNGLGGRSLKYLLDSYLGLDKDQIKRVKKTDSRWVTIVKSYPMVVLTEKEAYTLSSKT